MSAKICSAFMGWLALDSTQIRCFELCWCETSKFSYTEGEINTGGFENYHGDPCTAGAPGKPQQPKRPETTARAPQERPATRNNFPTTVVETKAAKRQPAPASTHKQPTTRQQGMVKTTPAPKKQARTKYSQEGKNPSKYLKTAPENQSSQAEAAHTIEQEAPM